MSPEPTSQGRSAPQEYARGVQLYRQGRFAEAADCLTELHDASGAAAAVARFYRGMAHRAIGIKALRQGQFDLAESHLLLAAKTAGPDADLAKYLASVYAQSGRNRQCADQMELVAARRDRPSSARQLAQALWQAGRREEALMTLTAALRRFGDVAELHLQAGLFAAATESFAEARLSFAAAAEADCDSADAYRYLGLTCSAVGDLPAAVRAFQRAFDLQPDNVLLAHELALAAKAAGSTGYNVVVHMPDPRLREAASEMRHMAGYVVAEPDFVDSFLALPVSEVDTELFTTLGNIVSMALADHPDYADLRLLSSRIHHRLGQTDEATAQARKALEINPRYAQALVHLGRLLAGEGRAKEAVEHLVRATQCGADWADVHYLIGELMADHAPAGAGEHYRRALELDPQYHQAREAASRLAA